MANAASIQPRWLHLKDAAKYSSVGRKRLVVLARTGGVRGFQDPESKRGDWIFDRESLDAYRESQASEKGADAMRNKALDILKRMGSR